MVLKEDGLNPLVVEELLEARAEFEKFCGYPVVLLSANDKVEVSLNLLHGAKWTDEFNQFMFQWLETSCSKKYRQVKMVLFKRAVDAFIEKHGMPIQGSCVDTPCERCFGKPGVHGKPDGYCYGNHGHFIRPLVYFQNFMRFLYFEEMPTKAFRHMRLEVEVLRSEGVVHVDRPLRYGGIGDLRKRWFPHFLNAFSDIRFEVSAFTRDLFIFMEALKHGFLRFALSIDGSVLERPNDITILQSMPAWASIVFGPTDSQKEVDAIKAKKLRIRTFFRRHIADFHPGKAITVKGIHHKECPSVLDKMHLKTLLKEGIISEEEFKQKRKDEVRKCFAGCTRCHGVNYNMMQQVMNLKGPEDLITWD